MQNVEARKASAEQSGAPREVLEAVVRKTPFAVLVGASVTHFEPGKVDLTVPIVKELTQHHGFVHGAVIGFVADSACAWAAASLVGDVVTSDYALTLMTPAVGSSIIGRGTVIGVNGRQVVCRADVFSEKNGVEKLVATALATIVKLK